MHWTAGDSRFYWETTHGFQQQKTLRASWYILLWLTKCLVRLPLISRFINLNKGPSQNRVLEVAGYKCLFFRTVGGWRIVGYSTNFDSGALVSMTSDNSKYLVMKKKSTAPSPKSEYREAIGCLDEKIKHNSKGYFITRLAIHHIQARIFFIVLLEVYWVRDVWNKKKMFRDRMIVSLLTMGGGPQHYKVLIIFAIG